MRRSTPDIGNTVPGFRLIAVSVLTLAALFSPVPAVAAEMLLDSGQSYIITPAETECLTITESSHAAEMANAECDKDAGTADVSALGYVQAGTPAGSIDVVASAAFQLWFRVSEVPGAAVQSRVPIHVAVPTSYAARLENDGVLENAGSAGMDIFLILRQDPELDPGGRGTVVESTMILSALHAGISGCITIPTDPVSAAEMALKCTLEAAQRMRGGGRSSLDYIVEVGRTYSLELQIIARANRKAWSLSRVGASTDLIFSDAPGLAWNEMAVTVGTDPAMLVAGLQEQIDELREDLENHTHNFLTGQGAGHNNVLAVSSPPIIPGDTADGKTIEQLQSGPVTGPPSENPGLRLQLGHRR